MYGMTPLRFSSKPRREELTGVKAQYTTASPAHEGRTGAGMPPPGPDSAEKAVTSGSLHVGHDPDQHAEDVAHDRAHDREGHAPGEELAQRDLAPVFLLAQGQRYVERGGARHRQVAAERARPQQHPVERPRLDAALAELLDGAQESEDVGVVLHDADDGYGDPVEQCHAHGVVLREYGLERVREHVEDMALLETADESEQRDIEEDGAPVELLQRVLEARGSLHAVTQEGKHQHQRDGSGQCDEAELHADVLAHGHRDDRAQEPYHDDGGEQRVLDLGLETQRRHTDLLVAAEAIGPHGAQ